MKSTPEKTQELSLKRLILPIFVILTLVVIGLTWVKYQFSGSKAPKTAPVEVKAGGVLPDFVLTSLPDHRDVPISQVKGKVILVNFWATWCEACMEEMDSLVRLRNRFHGDGFEIVGVNLDENPEVVVENVRQKYKIEFPIFVDPDGSVADLFDVHAIPASVVFDQNRKVLYLKEGGQDWYSDEIIKMSQRWLTQ